MIAFAIGIVVGLVIGAIVGAGCAVRWMEGELAARGISIDAPPPQPYGRIQCGFEDD